MSDCFDVYAIQAQPRKGWPRWYVGLLTRCQCDEGTGDPPCGCEEPGFNSKKGKKAGEKIRATVKPLPKRSPNLMPLDYTFQSRSGSVSSFCHFALCGLVHHFRALSKHFCAYFCA